MKKGKALFLFVFCFFVNFEEIIETAIKNIRYKNTKGAVINPTWCDNNHKGV